ncbi:MAG TPA: hypothetical protein VNF73_11465 [Candidatus Saccharimonadales bacterium]|nr:hypothetical protein [Candidatus Saccharimonadales bacterium]
MSDRTEREARQRAARRAESGRTRAREAHVPVEGGIRTRAIVMAVQRFHRMLELAMGKDEKSVVG